MYGYVTPVKENLSCGDFMLYRAYYCGICKATGKMYGQLPRFTTNYDIVFLSLLLSDYSKQTVEFECKGCVCNPFKKKTTVIRNELLDKLVNANIILSYYKMQDGVKDKEGIQKRALRRLLKGPYKKAVKACPKIDGIINKRFEELAVHEKNNTKGIDRVADCFAKLLEEVAAELLGSEADPNLLRLCYNVGKFVYLADALDDIDEDYKKKTYNPFLAVYSDYTGRREYLEKYGAELEFVLASTVNRAIECFNQIVFTESHSLLRNVVHKGLREKTEEIFKSTKKLPKPRL